jgi:alkanesulfonate monooxygenase SsuD/methylene tetrahydromethanopterin reductase-like flavin-dependent oxidoreductase (luciferase family)
MEERTRVLASIYTDLRPAPGSTADPGNFEEVVQLVGLAEELGYLGVWTTEQHGVNDGYLPAQLPVLAAFARESSRIQLGTGVVLLPIVQWRRLVEEACVVDTISHGRLVLGVGAGNYPHEFRAFRVPQHERGRLMEEGLKFIRPGLAGLPLADGLPINIPPAQRSIPLIVGGLANPAIDRAARLGDGHFGYAYVDPEIQLPRMWTTRLLPALRRHDRKLGEYRVICTTIVWVSDHAEREWHEVIGPAFLYQQRRYAEWCGDVASAEGYAPEKVGLRELLPRMLIGPADEIRDRLKEMIAQYPLQEIVLWPRLPGVPHGLAVEQLHRFAEGVMPYLDQPGTRMADALSLSDRVQ